MEKYQIKELYNYFKGYIPFFKDEQQKFNNMLNDYIGNKRTHLYINDLGANRYCEYLTDDEMKEKYNSGEYFYSGMFKNDEDCNYFENFRDKKNLDIRDFISYKTFCIYYEIKALRYFEKNIDEIIDIINDRY